MTSHNHAMFAGIRASFYTRLCGIRPLEPGYKKIGIKPYVPDKLEHVDTKMETIRGTIFSRWSKAGSKFTLEVEIPPDSTALVSIPSKSPTEIIIDNRKVDIIKEAGFLTADTGYAVFGLVSGRYKFQTLI